MAGTISKRGDGTYRLRVSMGSDTSGRPRRYSKTVHVSSRKEAEKELAKFYLECEKRKGNSFSDCTVKAFADLWWDEHVSKFTKISTRGSYKSALYYHIVPRFGTVRIIDLKTLMIQQWVNDMSEGGLSPKTIKNYFSVFNSMCEYAIKWDYLEQNPCRKVSLPKRTKHEARYYSESEVRLLIKTLDGVPEYDLDYVTAIYIGLFGGLRKGEILGLNEEDYLKEHRQLRIVRTRMLGRNIGPYEDTPKTETSTRIIAIPKELAAIIDRLMKYHADQKRLWGRKWKDSRALIKGRAGQPMYPQNLQRWFTRLIEKNNLPPLTLHGLRHTHTALLASMTDDIAQISRRLGHSEITTTLNIYTHLFQDNDRTLADGISEKVMGKEKTEEDSPSEEESPDGEPSGNNQRQ